jgi:hypothetical protein
MVENLENRRLNRTNLELSVLMKEGDQSAISEMINRLSSIFLYSFEI